MTDAGLLKDAPSPATHAPARFGTDLLRRWAPRAHVFLDLTDGDQRLGDIVADVQPDCAVLAGVHAAEAKASATPSSPDRRWIVQLGGSFSEEIRECVGRLADPSDLELCVFMDFADVPRNFDELHATLSLLDARGFRLFYLEDLSRHIYEPADLEAFESLFKENFKAGSIVALHRSRAMHVWCVCHYAESSGAGLCLLELVSELVADHWTLCTVISSFPTQFTPKFLQAGAGQCMSDTTWWCGDPADSSYFLDTARASIQRLSKHATHGRPDVVLTQTLVTPIGAMIAGRLGVPHMWSICEFGDLDHDLQFLRPLSHLARTIYDTSGSVIAISAPVARALFPIDVEGKVAVVDQHVTVDTALTRTEADIDPAAHLARGGGNLAIIGSLAPGKGQADAIRAIAVLDRRDIVLHLHLLGDGAMREELRRLAFRSGVGDRVHFWGHVENPFPIIAKMDAVLSCARSEAFGRTLVEAMLLERPVIYAMAGGPVDIQEDGVTGMSYPHGDALSLADRLETLMRTPGLGDEMGRQGRVRALKRYTSEAYGGEVRRRLEALVRNKAICAMTDVEILGRAGFSTAEITRYSSGRDPGDLPSLSAVSEELELAKDKIAKLSSDLAAVRLAHRRATTEAADLVASLSEARSLGQTLQAELTETRMDRDQHRTSLEQAKTEISGLKEIVQAMQKETERLSMNQQFLNIKLRRQRDE